MNITPATVFIALSFTLYLIKVRHYKKKVDKSHKRKCQKTNKIVQTVINNWADATSLLRLAVYSRKLTSFSREYHISLWFCKMGKCFHKTSKSDMTKANVALKCLPLVVRSPEAILGTEMCDIQFQLSLIFHRKGCALKVIYNK